MKRLYYLKTSKLSQKYVFLECAIKNVIATCKIKLPVTEAALVPASESPWEPEKVTIKLKWDNKLRSVYERKGIRNTCWCSRYLPEWEVAKVARLGNYLELVSGSE